MTTFNWGILGPGTVAHDFAKAINEVNGEIAAVGGRNLEKVQAFAEKFKIMKAYGSYEELIQDPDVDIMYIATPHTFHYEYIMKCLHENKHVICEKAITVNKEQLDEIVTLAKEKNLIVIEAMTVYHMPLYKKIKEMLSQGKLGKLKMIQVALGSLKEDDPTNRFFNPDLAGGAMLDVGTYALSFARYFLTEQPDEVLATVRPYQTGVDEQVGLLIRNKQDEMAAISLALRAKMPKNAVIAAEKGYVTIENFQRATKAIVTYTVDGSMETIDVGDSERAFEYEVEAMNRYVAGDEADHTLTLSVDVMAMMDEVRRQGEIKYPFE
ncbi:Gfo/Idh/MocA family protein [Falsibacillus albus]|uniref:Gfo/Idh/MocA family oxidoreductase n=1 Tax=Falsibacillus albus TaxID=2478915 RepID=A0A3L7JSI8_9BACI|nr:Gfo/Idh/MocA family oxidoreductase [Falsibacillus albus]RLQ93818.1 gfo/Idh/MocA family oxidoreductase [Falsibacillus albus]